MNRQYLLCGLVISIIMYGCTNPSNSPVTEAISDNDIQTKYNNNQNNQLSGNLLFWIGENMKRNSGMITENIPGCYFWQRDDSSSLGFKHHYLTIKLSESVLKLDQVGNLGMTPYKYRNVDSNGNLAFFADCQIPNTNLVRELLLQELDKRARKFDPISKTNGANGNIITNLQEPCGDHPCDIYWDPIEYAWICVAPTCDEDDGGYPWNPDPGSGGGGSSSVPSGVEPELFARLNAQEKALCWDSPVQCAMIGIYATWASNWAAQVEPIGPHNGPQDALRHAAWSGRIALEYNAHISLDWTDAHESNSSDPAETNMDLHNNTVGRQIGASANDLQHMTTLILQAYGNNELCTSLSGC